ncbi:MAG TPA: peptide chain release factor N(5)-glutamine methyltransferase, partial [Burkholderiales bacterium]|nr:peptide chain release factor N(5)-glutamine methyltransferase [Burkholderiales bacterium]
MKVSHALRQAARELGGDAATSNIEARALLADALAVDRAWLAAHSEDILEQASLSKFEAMLDRRLKGEPVAYILGFREFYGERFKVSRDVLVPRPETELLVDLALERIPENGRVLDLGTGSGAIAVTIARQRKNAFVTAVEKSSPALHVAMENGKGLENILFLESDWFDALKDKSFDVILSNLPYVAEGDEHLKDLA